MDDEMVIFNALNATKNLKIEKHGIPRVYYNGRFLKYYHAIAMTLFDGTVADRYKTEKINGRSLPNLTILSIFMQAVWRQDLQNELNIIIMKLSRLSLIFMITFFSDDSGRGVEISAFHERGAQRYQTG